MNIFRRILGRDLAITTRLGNPLGRDSGPFLARMNQFALMTGGRGFRVPRQEPRRDSQGHTRGDRKRAARNLAFGV